MKTFTFLILLVWGVSLGSLLLQFGTGNTPVFGLDFYFPLDLDEIKALSRIGISVSLVGGNAIFKVEGWEDPIEVVYIDTGNVSISRGFVRQNFPVVFKVKTSDWVLKINRTWVKISDKLRVLSDTGTLIYDIGKGWRIHLRPLDFLTLGYSSSGGLEFTLKLGELCFGYVNEGIRFALETSDFDLFLSLKDGMWIGYFSGEDYLAADENGVKFMKKVGNVYVAGRFQKKKFELKLEYPIEF